MNNHVLGGKYLSKFFYLNNKLLNYYEPNNCTLYNILVRSIEKSYVIKSTNARFTRIKLPYVFVTITLFLTKNTAQNAP